jgi:hypothetical protein
LQYSISSLTLFGGNEGCATSSWCVSAVRAMTAKSLIASYGSFGRYAALAMCEALVCMSV